MGMGGGMGGGKWVFKTLVAQWIRHWSSKPGIAGSSPAGGVKSLYLFQV